MTLSKFIDIKVFLLALFAGLFLSYVLSPKKELFMFTPTLPIQINCYTKTKQITVLSLKKK